MDRSRKFFLLMAALAMAAVVTVACDSGTQEPSAPDRSMPVPADDAAGDAADAQSESRLPSTDLPEGGPVTIPEGFPSELPIYPGSVPAIGKGAASDGVLMAAVQLQTSDTPEKVYDFYLESLGRDGWTIDEGASSKDKNTVSASNGKCTAMMLITASEEGGTDIFLLTEC